VLIAGIVTDFRPNCVVIDNGARVTWENDDTLLHDPGDGVLGDDTSECFKSTDFTTKNGMEFSDTFSGEFHFDVSEENLTFENIEFNDETPQGVSDSRDCPDRDSSDHTWTYNDDGDVAFRYICHIHEDDMAGWVIID
jgi:plastocyanin